MTDTLTPLQKAEKAVNEAELVALRAVKIAIEAFDKALDEAVSGAPTTRSDARRLAASLRSNVSYANTSELPSLINGLDPQPVPLGGAPA